MNLPADPCPVVREFDPQIDLKRHLDLPYGSLSTALLNTPEPRWRIEARQDAEAFSWQAVGLMLGWIAGGILLLATLTLLSR